DSRGGWTEDGRKVRGTIHWVSAEHATAHPVRLYDHLFTVEQPDSPPDPDADWRDYLNPDSLIELPSVFMEPELRRTPPGTAVQFLRNGYFFSDPIDSRAGQPVFNRIVPLRDSWAKKEPVG
ncbi:MAG: glutamine--tRNA ligase, partial [Candidatus Dadabacteria bacterium]